MDLVKVAREKQAETSLWMAGRSRGKDANF